MPCRDWLKTLWPASFRGVPFYVQHDEEMPGRRLVVHEFPNRDQPFIEDLGEAARHFTVEAYLASDTADSQAAALSAAIARSGAGVLVLPTHGPLNVRALNGSRSRDKDAHGFIAFRIEFVREGFGFALASVGMAASQVLAAASGLSGVAASAFARMDVAGRPERVAIAASSTLVEAASALEAMRTTYPVEASASATARDAIAALADDAAALVSRAGGADGSAATRLYDIASGLAAGMDATDARAAFADLVDFGVAEAPVFRSATSRAAFAAAGEAARAMRLAVLAAYAEALMAATFADRPSGIAARAEAAERFGAEMARCVGGPDAELFVALSELRGLVCAYLTRLITDLAPVAQVEAPRAMPSLWWAWRLYGDPARADEITARNRLPHPSFVPRTFEALVS
ncbi:DNA circularization N-terminal domain-containing protein [Xanthobacter sp. 91]|uniref:DNA circularization N-terminal domain-containing protein n=1 Tax=Xanthobacter sp. 91 TaxID=1117244 RepID=UPI00049705A1|nr:DNA circularization N-terminal domain-containing protein [Xanthobacter sp. 91]